MKLRSIGRLAPVAAAAALLAAACVPSGPEPTAVPTAVATATATATAAPTATPAPIPTLTPIATPVRTAEGLPFAALGDPATHSYHPIALAADPQLGRIYVYSSYGQTDGQDTVTALDAATLRMIGSVPLGGTSTSPSVAAQLAVDPDTHRVYAMNPDDHSLTILDGASLGVEFVVHGARRVAPAPGRLYVINSVGQVKLLSSTDYREQASIDWADGFEPDQIVYNPADDCLYLARWTLENKGSLIVLNGRTLEKLTEIPLPAPPLDVQLDGDVNEIYVATNVGLTVVDGAARRVARALNLEISSFNPIRSITMDRQGRRLYLSYNAGIALASGGGLIAIDLRNRAILDRIPTRHFWQGLLFDPGRNALYALPAMNDALLRVGSDGKVADRVMLGLRLLDMQVDPVTQELWTVDSGGSVRVLNASTLEPIRSLNGVIGSLDGAVEQANLALAEGAAYVSDVANGTTAALDRRTLEALHRLKAAGPLAIDPVGQRILIVDKGIQIFGLGSGKPVRRIPISAGSNEIKPIDVLWDAIAGRIYVKLRGGVNASVYRTFWRVFDAQGKAVLANYNPEYRDVEGLAVFPMAKRLYLAYAGASDWDRGLAEYDVGGAELGRVRGPSGQLVSSPDGAYLFMLREGGVWAFKRESLEPVAVLPLAEKYERMTIDPAGQRLYLRRRAVIAVESVAELLAGGIRPIDRLPEGMGLPATLHRSPVAEVDSTVLAIVPGDGVYRSADGGRTWLLSSRGLRDLFVTDLKYSKNYATDQTVTATTRNAIYRSTDGGRSWSSAPTWSPAILFVSQSEGRYEIQAMNADGSQVRRLGQNGTFGWQPSWAPDDEWLAFAASRDGNSDIYVIQVDGYGLARATDDPADDSEPAWSPDGSRIAFTSNRDGNEEIYVMDADGSNPTRITNDPWSDREPAWAPDSTRLVFTSDRSGHDELYVTTLATGELITLTTGTKPSYQPDWSPDGRWIAFVSEEEGDPDIWQVRPDGTERRQITSDPAAENWPVWLPDGRSLLFSSARSGRLQLYSMDLTNRVWKQLRADAGAQIQPSYLP